MGRLGSIVTRANRKLPTKVAALLIAGSTLLSSLLGLLRDRQLNGLYYSTYPQGIDAYTVAFSVPDFMFFVLISGTLSVTFIPVFGQRLASNNKKSAWELSTSILNLIALTTILASIAMIIFAEPLIKYIVGPGLDESTRALAVSLMRVIAVNPFLFGIAAVVSSIQQTVGRFTFYALSPVLYNLGIIIGINYFTNGINLFGWQIFEGGIMGVALGVVLGSILQLIVSCIGLFGLGLEYQPKIYWKNRGFRQVLRLLPARSINQGIGYINSMVETNMASRMATGTIRAFQQASSLSNVPINLIGVAISTAVFPKMVESLGDGRPDLFKKELQTILRLIIWLALPVAVITFLTRGYLIDFIKVGGDFLMASILGILAISIFFRSVYHISARSFYAQQDTKTPLYISVLAIALNIFLAIWFTLGLNLGAYGLALASAIVSAFEVSVLFAVMSRRIQGLFDLPVLRAIGKMVLTTAITGVLAYILVVIFNLKATDRSFYISFPKFALIATISGVAYLFVSWLVRLEEVRYITSYVTKFLARIKRRYESKAGH